MHVAVATDNFEYVLAVSNVPPIAVAGDDQGIFLDDAADLEGSGTDPAGDAITAHSWAIDSAPASSTAALSLPLTATPGFTPDVAGIYVLSLVVSDGTAWSLPDTLTLTVAENLPPIPVAAPNPTRGDVSLAVAFDGTDCYDPEDLTYV